MQQAVKVFLYFSDCICCQEALKQFLSSYLKNKVLEDLPVTSEAQAVPSPLAAASKLPACFMPESQQVSS